MSIYTGLFSNAYICTFRVSTCLYEYVHLLGGGQGLCLLLLIVCIVYIHLCSHRLNIHMRGVFTTWRKVGTCSRLLIGAGGARGRYVWHERF